MPAGWLGDFYVGLRQLQPAEYDTYIASSDITDKLWKGGENTFTGNYSIKIYTSSCVYYDEQKEDWMTDGCRVSNMMTQQEILDTFISDIKAIGGFILKPQFDFNREDTKVFYS